MNNFFKAAIVISAFIAAAQCLQCRQCLIGLFGTCRLSEGEVTCNNATESCYTAETNFNTTDSLVLEVRGCLSNTLCGLTLNGSFLGTAVSTNFRCCTTDLCNGASSVQLPLTVALSAAILSSVFGLWDV